MGLLHDAGLAEFYQRDIHALNPLLEAMSRRGMPVDESQRLAAAQAVQVKRTETLTRLRALIPPEICPKNVYKKQPTKTVATTAITVTVQVPYCLACGARRPNRKHPCQAQIELREEQQMQYEVRLPFVPSPKGLLAYLRYKGYSVPKKYDRATGEKRATTDEAALLRLALQHEADPIFALVLEYRDCDKQLSTYLGRPTA